MPQACEQLQSSAEAFSMPEEVWRTLAIRADYYISNLGRVKGPRGIINTKPGERGYLRFSLMQGGKKHNIAVHQEVCRAFHPDTYFEGAMALHRNHIKTDCREENLYWGTHQQNMDDRKQAGRISTRLTAEEVQEIRRRHKAGESQGSLGRAFGVTQQYVGKLVKGVTWKDVA